MNGSPYNEGRMAFHTNKDALTCPYEPDTLEHHEWIEGYRAACAAEINFNNLFPNHEDY